VGPAIPKPADDEAILFLEPDFQGQSFSIRAGEELPVYKFADKQISSIILGKEIKLELCSRAECDQSPDEATVLAYGP